jgi:hypothetical protein
MAKSDLLKQAIADANAVKETALANAKIALQEAFAPRIQSMLSARLSEELEDEEGDVENPEAMGDEGAPAPEADVDGGDEGVNWVDNDISFSVGGDTYDYEISEPGEEEMQPEAGAEAPEAGMSDEEASEEYNEELNLESIIRELEADLEGEGEDEMMADGYMHGEDEGDDMIEDGYMHGDEDDEDMMESALRSSGIGRGKGKPSYGKKPKAIYEAEDDEDKDETIDEIIEAILREEDMEGMEDVEDEPMVPAEELDNVKTELGEAYRTVRHLKGIINEVNLLNAKLLYTNKLFRNFELNESQKMKVIENFDRAGTTREVKLVFTTLAESFNRPTKKRVVRESYASKPIATTAPTNAPILNEGFELADRWKKLAGLL